MKPIPATKMATAVAEVWGWLEPEIPYNYAALLVDWSLDRRFWQIVTHSSLPALMYEGEPRTSLSLNYEQESNLCA